MGMGFGFGKNTDLALKNLILVSAIEWTRLNALSECYDFFLEE